VRTWARLWMGDASLDGVRWTDGRLKTLEADIRRAVRRARREGSLGEAPDGLDRDRDRDRERFGGGGGGGLDRERFGGGGLDRVHSYLREQLQKNYQEAMVRPDVLLKRILQLEQAMQYLSRYAGYGASPSALQSMEAAHGRDGREVLLVSAAMVALAVKFLVLRGWASSSR
jgi:hypothetical protein